MGSQLPPNLMIRVRIPLFLTKVGRAWMVHQQRKTGNWTLRIRTPSWANFEALFH